MTLIISPYAQPGLHPASKTQNEAHSQAFVPPSQPLTDGRQLPTSMPLPVLPAVEAAKRLAAFAAVDRHIGLQHRVIGIGSGSTVPYVVDRIVAQGKEANLKRVFIPTGTSLVSPVECLALCVGRGGGMHKVAYVIWAS
jgi:ribose 5-phosphate isomerase A